MEGVLIEAGQKIGYQLNRDATLYKGEISSVKDSSIVINGKEIFLNEITLITLKPNSKKNILGGLTVFDLEGALIGAKEIAGNDSKFLCLSGFYTFIPAVGLGSFLIVRGVLLRNLDD